MIALLGTTGKIGGAALKALQPHQVRAVTRQLADMRDPQALTQALQGAEAVLVILPFDPKTFHDLDILQQSLLQTLARVRPAHFLFISDYGAHHPEGTGIPAIFHHFEKHLLGLGLPCTILRSAEHMQNLLRPGQLQLYPPNTAARPFVSACDVGEIAAQLLSQPAPSAARILHVEGSRRYELDEIGERKPIPPEFRQTALARAGLPPGLVKLLDATFAAHGQGLIEVEPGGEVLHGTTSLDQVLAGL